MTTDYTNGAFTTTTVSYTRTGLSLSVNVATTGTFTGVLSHRHISLRFPNTAPPTSVLVNGVAVGYSLHREPLSWNYDGRVITTEVVVGDVEMTDTLNVVVVFGNVSDTALSGIKCGIAHASIAKSILDKDLTTPGAETTAGMYLDLAAGYGETLTFTVKRNMTEAIDLLRGYWEIFRGAKREIYALQPYQNRMLLQLWSEGRRDTVLCGSNVCMDSNSDYQQLSVEGWQPLPNDDGAVPLYLYYSSDLSDNYATTSTSVPAGYTLGVQNGYVLSVKKDGTVPLRVFYSERDHDYLTTATKEGEVFALSRGYTLQSAVVGYVYAAGLPPDLNTYRETSRKRETLQKPHRETVFHHHLKSSGNPSRLSYADALMGSC
jgi:hypothetical protein